MPDRLFVATWPDDAARSALRLDLERVRPGLEGLRWQAEDRWHLTLAFLGQRDPDAVRGRLDRLVLPRAEPIRLRGSGTFGSIVWIGVEHGPWLDDLARGIQRALHASDRRFRAHVTVGRARGPAGTGLARRARDLLRPHEGPAWIPPAITLVESQLGPQPRYTVRARWPLGAPTTPDAPPCGSP